MNHLDYLNRIKIVLVEPSHPGNIGAVARAMKNMDISDLVLVSPKEYPSEVANQRASGATDILEEATVVDSLAEALADCHLVFGTSSRGNRLAWPHKTVKAAAEHSADKLNDNPNLNVAFVFGRERCGLYNEELQQCHFHVSIPTSSKYASLNLSQAVQVTTYEIFGASQKLTGSTEKELETMPSNQRSFNHLMLHLKTVLLKTGFLDERHSKNLLPKLKRLFLRANLDEEEVNILSGFVRSVDQKLTNTLESD